MSKISNFLVVLILIFTLSGCFGAIFGATVGGAGAYYAKREFDKSDKRKKHAVEKKTRIEERELFSRKVKDNVNKDDKISLELTKKMLGGGLTKIISMHTIVKEGVVTLYGNAPSQKVVDRAIDIARREQGVKKVVNNLVVVEVRIIPPKVLKRSVSAIPVPTLSPDIAKKSKEMELKKTISKLENKSKNLKGKTSKKVKKAIGENPLIKQLREDGTLQKNAAFKKEMRKMKNELLGIDMGNEINGLTIPTKPSQ